MSRIPWRMLRSGSKVTLPKRCVLASFVTASVTLSMIQFADLEAAYLLLRNYTELQRKATDRKANLVALQDESDELRQQLESALGNYQELKHNLYDQKARCEELERLRDEDRQRYKDAENELEEKYAELDSTWTG